MNAPITYFPLWQSIQTDLLTKILNTNSQVKLATYIH